MDLNFGNSFTNGLEDELLGKKNSKYDKMHLRLQQRSAKKCITILEGANQDFDLKGILRGMKKKFSCGGAIKRDADGEAILTLTGDQRESIVDFLVNDKKVASKEDFVVHGY